MFLDLPFSLSEPRFLLLLLSLVPVIALGQLSAVARPRDRGRIRASTAIRSAILVAVVLALAGLQFISTGGPLNLVVILDESGSVSAADREAAASYVQLVAAGTGPDARLGVVRFGEQAVIDRALGTSPAWEPSTDAPPALATNLEDALQLASALFPESGSRRIILLTDGQETTGDAASLARRLSDQGIQLSVVPLGAAAANEVSVDQVLSPHSAPLGQELNVRALVRSTTDREAIVQLLDNDVPVDEKSVQLQAGENAVDLQLPASSQGFHVLKAVVRSIDDRIAENNTASSFTLVGPPPSVLVIAGAPEDALPLSEALTASKINVKVVQPRDVPLQIDTLLAYDTVILANASSEAIGNEGQLALQSFVRDSGRGLIMLGGDGSFGAGGYLRSPLEEVLPVSMDVRTSEERASMAMTFVVDKSGSMGRCHCGGNQQFDPAMRTEFGVNKLDIIKQAILKASAIMNSSDKVGVVGFDEVPRWLVNMQDLGTVGETGLRQSLQPIVAQGDTHLHPGLETAVAGLKPVDAELKHIVLMTDGWSKEADFTDLLGEIRASGMTLTTVGAGEGASALLKDLAARGNGEYYEVKDIRDLPDILLRETVRMLGAYFVEEPVAPVTAGASPILEGLAQDDLPVLYGYNSTTLKPSAEGILRSARGDPLLAQWQYGLGRSVAWTADMKGRWGTDWVQWADFSRFAGQLVNWTLPRDSSPGMEAAIDLQPGTRPSSVDAILQIESVTGEGMPRNFLSTTVVITNAPGTDPARQFTAVQTSPGRYAAEVPDLSQGVYSLTVEQRDAQSGEVAARLETGLVVPYPSEFRLSVDAGANAARLIRQLTTSTGGRVLSLEQPSDAWSLDVRPQPQRVPLWPWLLTLAIVLFPLDVALRRLTITPNDFSKLFTRARGP